MAIALKMCIHYTISLSSVDMERLIDQGCNICSTLSNLAPVTHYNVQYAAVSEKISYAYILTRVSSIILVMCYDYTLLCVWKKEIC